MQKTKHHSGFISIVGNPNVGKSTLMNALMGMKLSITTHKAQTTRHRILGILNGENYQMILSDTPGIIKPAYEMQNSMMSFVKESFIDADLIIYMIAIGETQIRDEKLYNRLKSNKTPVLVLINKIDNSNQEQVQKSVKDWENLLPNALIYPISALTGFFVKELLKILISKLPEGPEYFPKDQITDKPERFFVNETIRSKILENYEKEIPYSVEVQTEEFIEDKKMIRIKSVILVERESQKGIIIGHKGNKLKIVGSGSRKSLQSFFEKKIYLELYVKVSKNWRSNISKLRHFGYRK
ncbi:MAG: GTPase Era [Flavobacteriaceae bacterium]|nr:GTPase Era [Flavobacteriaceae bacterium]|tara:strand:- start:2845 stop:3735 length:891 start_codon:yes stop_codon:yes gene_type:complete